MYRGRHTLGQHLNLSVRTTDGATTPLLPDACPVLDVYTAAGVKVRSRLIPVADAGAVTGYFAYRLFLGADLAVGQYLAVYHWRSGSAAYAELDTFEVTGGGQGEGCVLAMREFVRPNARFVVHQLDSGKLKRGRNPRL